MCYITNNLKKGAKNNLHKIQTPTGHIIKCFDYFELSEFKEKSDRVEIHLGEGKSMQQINWKAKDFTNKSGCMIIQRVNTLLPVVYQKTSLVQSPYKRNWKLVARWDANNERICIFFKSIGSTLEF